MIYTVAEQAKMPKYHTDYEYLLEEGAEAPEGLTLDTDNDSQHSPPSHCQQWCMTIVAMLYVVSLAIAIMGIFYTVVIHMHKPKKEWSYKSYAFQNINWTRPNHTELGELWRTALESFTTDGPRWKGEEETKTRF
jgi:hypothetical protein